MKIVIGLGNPGKKYENTRHNIGQWFIDAISQQSAETPKALTVEDRSNSQQVKLHKTSTFMNESGKEVKKLATRYLASGESSERKVASSLPATDLLVAHDDLDLEPGKWKFQFAKSSAGHKGVQSVIDELGTKEFWRLRIGVGKPPPDMEADQFVLEEPTAEEGKLINKAIEESVPYVLEWTCAL